MLFCIYLPIRSPFVHLAHSSKYSQCMALAFILRAWTSRNRNWSFENSALFKLWWAIIAGASDGFISLMCFLAARRCWLLPSWYFIDSNLIEEHPLTNADLSDETPAFKCKQKWLKGSWKNSKKYSKKCYMFVWTGGFKNLLVHTDFNMFVDE